MSLSSLQFSGFSAGYKGLRFQVQIVKRGSYSLTQGLYAGKACGKWMKRPLA